RDGDQDLALVRAERGAHALADRLEQLAVLELGAGRAAAGELLPGLGVERDLTVLPGPAAHLDRRLQDCELGRPGREPAVAAVAGQLSQDRHQRIVGGLHGDVGGLAGRPPAEYRAPAVNLEAGDAERLGMETRHGLVAGPTWQ